MTLTCYSYARFFAARGAKVVINDVSAQAAQAVVDEITKSEHVPL
jgi:multifunctional beta-oxidation protein